MSPLPFELPAEGLMQSVTDANGITHELWFVVSDTMHFMVLNTATNEVKRFHLDPDNEGNYRNIYNQAYLNLMQHNDSVVPELPKLPVV